MKSPAYNEKHYLRALRVVAEYRCSTDLTNGFCAPRDGECQRGNPRMRGDCITSARGILESLATYGIMVVWAFDKELPEPLRNELRKVASHDPQ